MYQQKNSFILASLPLFFVLFIDGMGLSLLIPIVNNIIINPSSMFLPQLSSPSYRTFVYGLVIGIFMLCWFFGAAILGDLSDQIGRKKSMSVCLFGASVGYALSAIAIFSNSLALLIIGRMIAGFTAGSQPIAQAAIVDLSNERTIARNIGFIILSISLGFAFGPLIGGILSNSNIVSWFNFTTPMIFAALASLLNLLLLQLTFKETRQISKRSKIQLHRAISIFISAFKHYKIRYLSFTFLIFIIGWSSYFTFVPAYLFRNNHFSAFEVSMYLVVMGCGFAVGCGFLVGYLTKHFSCKRIVSVAMIITAICILLTLISTQQYQPWILTFFIGIAMATAYSVILAIFSGLVNANEQGWVMGVTGSIMALCFGITSILGGLMTQFGPGSQLLLAGIGLLLAACLMMFFKPKKDVIVSA